MFETIGLVSEPGSDHHMKCGLEWVAMLGCYKQMVYQERGPKRTISRGAGMLRTNGFRTWYQSQVQVTT